MRGLLRRNVALSFGHVLRGRLGPLRAVSTGERPTRRNDGRADSSLRTTPVWFVPCRPRRGSSPTTWTYSGTIRGPSSPSPPPAPACCAGTQWAAPPHSRTTRTSSRRRCVPDKRWKRLSFKALCSPRFASVEAQLWICHGASSCADHVQRRASNSEPSSEPLSEPLSADHVPPKGTSNTRR